MTDKRYPPISTTDYICVGYIRRPHALTGEVVADLSADLSALLMDKDSAFVMLTLVGLMVPFRLTSYRERGDGKALMRFAGVESKDYALTLQGAQVFIHHEYIEDEDSDDSAINQCVGYEVRDEKGCLLGKLTQVDESTINTLIQVLSTDGDTLLLPAPPDLLCLIDREHKRITLSVPEGLLDMI